MLDIKFIRENPEKVKVGCKKKNAVCDVDGVLALDEKRKEAMTKIETLRSEQNKLGKADIEKAKELKNQIKELYPAFKDIDERLNVLLLQFPNMPFDEVPVGKDESANVLLRKVGEIPQFDFEPKDHIEIGEQLDIIDVERGGKVAGSRFGYLKGPAALMEFALVNFIMKRGVEAGFTPIVPPVFVKKEMMSAMGYIDTSQDLAERYFFEKENLFLVGTAEQSVGPMHANEVFAESDLPRRYIAFSTCFREEAGSYGKDTKGILRVHQFDKVELFSYTTPEKSKEEHRFLIDFEEQLWRALRIPYRVMQLSTGDMSRPSASTVDIEAWLAGQPVEEGKGKGRYREVSSASNVTDFQARRLNIRFRNKENKMEFVHMLNATGFPIGRTIIAILENYQQKDGSVRIPEVLQEYMPMKKIPA